MRALFHMQSEPRAPVPSHVPSEVEGKALVVACILIFVLQPAWVKGVVPAGRPPVAEARFARIESLWGRSAPRPLLPGRGESEAFRACVYKLDRRRWYRVGEPELQPAPRRL